MATASLRTLAPRLFLRAMSSATVPRRTYKDAIDCLNSCQSNAATIEAIRKSGGKANQYSIPEMLTYLSRMGYTPDQLNALNVMHVTGTKGKGSTCAFIERTMRGLCEETGVLGLNEEEPLMAAVDGEEREWYGGIGLYTSPHLCAVRERIRINGKPLSESLFAKFFFEVWDRLEAATPTQTEETLTSPYPSPVPLASSSRTHPPIPPHPVYFRFLTLLAFHVFLSLRVRLTVLEVGIGGTYDSTNIVPRPLVTGVSSLGLDHTFVLGNSVEEIARNKGGIYKNGVPALAVRMDDGKGEVELAECAEKAGAPFSFVPPLESLQNVPLGLPGKHQIINASLAVAMCKSLVSKPDLPDSLQPLSAIANSPDFDSRIQPYLSRARWPGRCQLVDDPSDRTRWFIDGAHTVESLACCGEWLAEDGSFSRSEAKRILIFNCTSGRSASQLLTALLKGLGANASGQDPASIGRTFAQVIFCTNVTYNDGGFKGDLTSKAINPDDLSALATQHALKDAWLELVPEYPQDRVRVLPSIQDAVEVVRKARIEGAVNALTAGSLHLVGGTIEVAGLADVALSMD